MTVTFPRVLRSEWIKLSTLRSSRLALLGAVAAMLATALVVAFTTNTAAPGTLEADSALPEASLQGFLLAQLVVGVLGALFVSGEYGTGMVRATFAAVPRRLPVLGAKAVVVGAVTLAAMTVAAFASFGAAQLVLAGGPLEASLADDGVLRAVAGTGAYLAVVALIGTGLGWILRSTASAIGTLTALLLVVPSLAPLLPAGLEDVLARLLPSTAGQALMSTVPDGPLSPLAGLGVLVAWAAGTLLAAAVLLRRRDV